jgi:hypothetical protein
MHVPYQVKKWETSGSRSPQGPWPIFEYNFPIIVAERNGFRHHPAPDSLLFLVQGDMGAFWVLRQAEGRRKTCDATSYNSGVVGAGMQ